MPTGVSNHGDSEKYEKYLIMAALSDLKCCTMENMALQSLAVFLFQKGDKYIERAEQYISTSMEDAKFYNNRLRIIEISRIMPQIMSNYRISGTGVLESRCYGDRSLNKHIVSVLYIGIDRKDST